MLLGGALWRAARHGGLHSASDLAVLLLVGNPGVLPHLAPSTVLPSSGAASGGAPLRASLTHRASFGGGQSTRVLYVLYRTRLDHDATTPAHEFLRRDRRYPRSEHRRLLGDGGEGDERVDQE